MAPLQVHLKSIVSIKSLIASRNERKSRYISSLLDLESKVLACRKLDGIQGKESQLNSKQLLVERATVTLENNKNEYRKVLTHSLTKFLTLTHSLTYLLTHSITYSLTLIGDTPATAGVHGIQAREGLGSEEDHHVISADSTGLLPALSRGLGCGFAVNQGNE